MKILRYTDKVQEQLQSKTKPEPWLHVAIDMPKDQGSALYAIYVWDTRQVVEEGAKMILDAKRQPIDGTSAKDNHQSLVGLKQFAKSPAFNFAIDQKQFAMYKQAVSLYKDYQTKLDAYRAARSSSTQYPSNETVKANDAMMRAVHNIAEFGRKHGLSEWIRLGNIKPNDSIVVVWPSKLRKFEEDYI